MEKFLGGSIAVICGSIMLKGQRELSAIERAVHQLYELNEALRIQMAETQNGTMQKVVPNTEQKLAVLRFAE